MIIFDGLITKQLVQIQPRLSNSCFSWRRFMFTSVANIVSSFNVDHSLLGASKSVGSTDFVSQTLNLETVITFELTFI